MRLLRFAPLNGAWNLDDLGRPWGDRDSLYAFLVSAGAGNEAGFGGPPPPLPDDVPEDFEGRSLPLAARRVENLPVQPRGTAATAEIEDEGDSPERLAERLVFCLEQLLAKSQPEALATLLDELAGVDLPAALDPLMAALAKRPLAPHDRVREVARYLATEAAERNPVKLGIALLGLFGEAADEELIYRLGRHDEFTLVAAVSLQHLSARPEAAVYRLARAVSGWGRIHAVERLATARSPEVRRWLLLEGYRNDVLLDYTALIAARAGQLTTALAAPAAAAPASGDTGDDGRLLEASGEILRTLIQGVDGPAEGIDQWEEGALAVELWLRRAQHAPLSTSLLHVTQTILDFIRDEDEPWSDYAEHGWSAERIQAIERGAAEILSRPDSRRLIENTLSSAGDGEFRQAVEVAPAVGVDPWPTVWARLERGEPCWDLALKTEDWSRAERVVAWAEATLPLSTLATGPSGSSSPTADSEACRALAVCLAELRRFPALGWELVATGLKCQARSTRQLALKTLSAWGNSCWGPEVRPALQRALFTEPEGEIKERIKRLLAGRPLDDEG